MWMLKIRPPQNQDHMLQVPWVVLIVRFHCILLTGAADDGVNHPPGYDEADDVMASHSDEFIGFPTHAGNIINTKSLKMLFSVRSRLREMTWAAHFCTLHPRKVQRVYAVEPVIPEIGW